MLKLKYKNFPEYLKESDFYKNLTSKDSIYIPEENFKKDNSVNSLEDFKQLFKTINFFGLDYPEQMKKYFNKNNEEIFDYYYKNIDELNVFFMFKYLFGSEENFNLYLVKRIKEILDEVINYLNKKEKKSKKEYVYYEFDWYVTLKSKLKKKYVRIILEILNVLKNKNFLLLKDILLSKNFKEQFKNIKQKCKDIELIKVENLGDNITLNKINSSYYHKKWKLYFQRIRD
uniref:Uncharacterized protein n=1 Tax=viral metagenome TaxID=1070528 RepID=A0A6C0AE05_9ZZZZ